MKENLLNNYKSEILKARKDLLCLDKQIIYLNDYSKEVS